MSNKKKSADAGYQFPGQLEDEIVELVFRQHPLVMRKALIFGLLAVVVAVLPFDFPQIYDHPAIFTFFKYVVIGLPLVVLFAWFHRWVGWFYSIFIVTDRRLVIIGQKGFFDRSVEEWQLDKIYNVNYRIDGFQAMIFGYGDITTMTIMGEYLMPKIHKPVEIHRHLLEAVQAAGGGKGPKETRFDN